MEKISKSEAVFASKVAASDNNYPDTTLSYDWLNEVVSDAIGQFGRENPDRKLHKSHIQANLIFDDSDFEWRLQVVITTPHDQQTNTH
jgi:hypothetical protein